MPNITAIEPQKSNSKSQKLEKRFNIFIDDKFAFGVSEENLLKYKIKMGAVVSERQIEQILEHEREKKMTDQAINYLSYRPRSEKEIRDFLIKKISLKEKIKFQDAKNSPQIESTIDLLKKYKFVNDYDFAKWWIESRNRSRQKGIRAVKVELGQKGINQDIVDKLLEKAEDQLSLALKVLQKKKAKLLKLTPFECKQKSYYYLASRGFDMNTIKEAFAIFAKKV